MADGSPDDLESLFDQANASTPDSSSRVQLFTEEGGPQEPSHESQKDTLKSAKVQVQDVAVAQKPGVVRDRKAQNSHESVLQRIAREAKEESERAFYHGYVKKEDSSDRRSHLRDKKAELNELLAWKERLKLRAIHEFIPVPYYTSWSKEANLFFRRLVIIKRRMENIKE